MSFSARLSIELRLAARSASWTRMALGFVAIALAAILRADGRPAPAGPAWTSIGPDSGAAVQTLAVDPTTLSTIYAGTSLQLPRGPAGGSVYKSVDSGAHWRLSSAGLPARRVAAVAVDPSHPTNVYAGTAAGVFRSSDGAATWSPANVGLTDIGIADLAVDPATPSTLYAATPSGVFKSSDGAGSWNSSSLGLQGVAVQTLAIDSANPSTLYAGTGIGVFKSPDGAASWTPSGNFPSATVLALSVGGGSPSAVYAATAGDLWKSIDFGITWSSVRDGLASGIVRAVAAGPASTNVAYASVDGGSGSLVFRTSNGGGTWSSLPGGPSTV